jgi:hypothetical protein
VLPGGGAAPDEPVVFDGVGEDVDEDWPPGGSGESLVVGSDGSALAVEADVAGAAPLVCAWLPA